MTKPIKITKVFDASVDDVWEALTNKELLSEWLMPCDFVAKVGHEFQFKTKSAIGFSGVIHCKVIAIKEKELLSYSWSGGPLKDTVVVFRLSPQNGQTRLDLEHSGFKNSISNLLVRKILANGWKKIITVRLFNNLAK